LRHFPFIFPPGLRLHLDIEEDQYTGALTKEAGVRVSIQEQGVMPFPYEKGFSVAPGMATLVGMWKVCTFYLFIIKQNGGKVF
jgi:hypothetical protein